RQVAQPGEGEVGDHDLPALVLRHDSVLQVRDQRAKQRSIELVQTAHSLNPRGRSVALLCVRRTLTGPEYRLLEYDRWMQYRTFGRTGWPVSEIGYGMWGMAGWTGSDDAESLASLERAIALGCTFFDTAWGYGAGHSEKLLGEVVRSHPDKSLIVATKLPPRN